MNEVKPGVCFGFSLIEINNADYKLEMIFNDRIQENQAQMIPS